MGQHTITVIVLGYNGREFLGACLSSVLDQDLPRDVYEVLYVDNASNDGSPAFVRKHFRDVRVLELDANYGFAEGNNRGVMASDGRYIALVNQDAVCHKRWLSELLRVLEENPDIVAVHANVLTPWSAGYEALDREADPIVVQVAELNRFGFVAYEERPATVGIIETIHVAGAAMMIRREAAERSGYLFDPDFFMYCEDTELALRIQNVGQRVALVPTAVVYHDLRPSTSLSWTTLRKTLLIMRNRFLAYYKNMDTSEFLTFLPWLVIGAPLKPGELALGRMKSLLYAIGIVPLVPIALGWAALTAHKVSQRRADVLAQRTVAPKTLSRALRASGVR